jgi:four helix bundle protein
VNELRRKHRELRVWQEAVAFTSLVYRETEVFPKSEQFGLTSQLRRASVAIATHLAEGAARKGSKEFLPHVALARSSAAEVDTLVEIARQVGCFVDSTKIESSLDNLVLLILRFEATLKRKTAA